MGILNITPDSFSDGARYSDPGAALDRALQMIEEGADILDIGGESTRPDALPVAATDELARVLPLLEQLAGRIDVPLSIDTTKALVAEAALAAGAEIVNDISGFMFDPAMASVVARARAGAVLMHTRGRPTEMQNNTWYADLPGEVGAGLAESVRRALAAGCSASSLVVDPGICFGKDLRGNLELLRTVGDLPCVEGVPLLLGTSRKSFIGKVLGRDVHERLFGTAATVALGVAAGVSIFRVHDVKEMRDVADMAAAVCGRWLPANL